LRVYAADQRTKPVEVAPPPGRSRYWTRRGLAEWLIENLIGHGPTIVGVDHGFSFPWRYFESHDLETGLAGFSGGLPATLANGRAGSKRGSGSAWSGWGRGGSWRQFSLAEAHR
jgi:hypothetical protein